MRTPLMPSVMTMVHRSLAASVAKSLNVSSGEPDRIGFGSGPVMEVLSVGFPLGD